MQYSERIRPLMYGLSTCGWCSKARAWLDQNVGDYELVYVDLLDDDARVEALAEIHRWVDLVSFPLVIIGESVVVGYRPAEYIRLLEGEYAGSH